MPRLNDFQPLVEKPETLIEVPTFIQGAHAQAFEPEFEKARKDNPYFAFKGIDNSGVLKGSNVFSNGLANKLVSPNFRIITPTDNIYQAIFPMIENNFYTDLNALDVWDEKPSYEKNTKIWQQIIKLAEKHLDRDVKFPFRIQGFYCIPNKRKAGDYQARIEPAPNFRIIEDDKLNLPTGTKFNELDEKGMVKPFDNGRFTKYTLKNGLSRVFLVSVGYLSSSDYDLGDTDDSGRVVVVSAEGVAQKLNSNNLKK